MAKPDNTMTTVGLALIVYDEIVEQKKKSLESLTEIKIDRVHEYFELTDQQIVCFVFCFCFVLFVDRISQHQTSPKGFAKIRPYDVDPTMEEISKFIQHLYDGAKVFLSNTNNITITHHSSCIITHHH
jgi:hypothetical protein